MLRGTRGPVPEFEHPPCVVCGGPHPQRRPGEDRTNYRLRRTCSRACQLQLVSRKLLDNGTAELTRYTHPPCPECGGAVPMRAGEILANWKLRQTCSDRCNDTLRRRNIAKIAPTEREPLDPCRLEGNCFSQYNVALRPDYRRLPERAPTLVVRSSYFFAEDGDADYSNRHDDGRWNARDEGNA